MKSILTIDAARGLHRSHAKMMHDLDRIRTFLPADMADALLEPVDLMGWEGEGRRAYRLPVEALAFLFMGRATRLEIEWIITQIMPSGACKIIYE